MKTFTKWIKTKVLKTWEGTDICRVLRTASCALGTSKLQLWVANLIAECQRRVCCGNMSKGSGRLAGSVLCSIEFDFCKISVGRFSLSRMFPCSAFTDSLYVTRPLTDLLCHGSVLSQICFVTDLFCHGCMAHQSSLYQMFWGMLCVHFRFRQFF